MVEAVNRVGINRTGSETRLGDTGVTGMWCGWRPGQPNFTIEQKRGPVGVPEPVSRVHQDAQRGGPQPFSTFRPLLEGKKGAIRRKDSAGAHAGGDMFHDVARPRVERMVALRRLQAPLPEMPPHVAADISDEKQGADVIAPGYGDGFAGCEVETAPQAKAMRLKSGLHRVEAGTEPSPGLRHSLAPPRPSGVLKALRQTSLWMISATLARPVTGSFHVKASGIESFLRTMNSFSASSTPSSRGGAS